MGYRDYPKYRRNNVWATNNPLMMLIILNVLIFILLHFIKSIYAFSSLSESLFMQNTFSWFTMPADLLKLAQRPWTLLTAMFTQLNMILLLSNLFWLWTFGFILQDLAGERRVFPLYLYGGMAGGISFLLTYNIMPSLADVREATVFFGATTPVIAVAVAATVLSPMYRLFPMINGGIPLWIITFVFFIIDIASISAQSSMFFSHVASAAVGYVFSQELLKGNDWSAWMNNLYDNVTNLFNPKRNKKGKVVQKEEVFYNTRGQQPFVKRTNVTQQKVDEILDKINQKGYSRLSEEEKDLLKRASEGDL